MLFQLENRDCWNEMFWMLQNKFSHTCSHFDVRIVCILSKFLGVIFFINVFEMAFCCSIVYREVKDENTYDTEEGRATPTATPYSRSGDSSVAGTTLSPSTPIPGTPSVSSCTVEDVLQLLRHLFVISTAKDAHQDLYNLDQSVVSEINPDQFSSKKITNKLLQQIQDPLVLSSSSLPAWCEELNHSCPFLFPFETRQLFFNCTAFGASRSIGN